MKITYLGHSCFLFISETGKRIVTDPYGEVGFAMLRVRADVVTVSHSHYDHCNVGAVEGAPVVLREAGDYGDIRAIACFHDEAKGAKRGKNLIFKYRIDGIDVCHLGDLGERCTPELVRAISPVQVLLIPVGGTYTIDARMAKEYVDALRPAVVIPMHYKTKGLTIGIAGAEEFLSYFPQWERAGDTIECKIEAGQPTKIIFMERKV